MELLFLLSIFVIVCAAAYAALAPCVPGGPFLALFIGGAAVFALAGADQRPPNWVIGFTACVAGACACTMVRWLWYRRAMRRGANDYRAWDRM
jgi:membrane protein implicated in regulation of membrane protease activity